MPRLALALAAALLLVPAAADAGPTEDFHRLMDDYWAATLKNSPTLASSVGVTTYDSLLDELSLAEMDRQAAEAASFLRRLEAIPIGSLSAADRTNHAILRRSLENAVEANRFGQRQMLFSTLGSYHGFLAGIAENQPFRSLSDYRNYLKRIALVSDRMRAYGEISTKAAGEGFTQPCVTLSGFADTVRGEIAAEPARSRFYLPFAGPRPAGVGEAQWRSLQAEAASLIRDRINPSYEAFARLYETRLAPRCRTSVGISGTPQGKAYYDFLVRLYTTTDLSPDAIHRIGLSEVAAIRAQMTEVARKAGYASREAMIAEMRSNPKYFASSPAELLKETALVTKTIDGKMPSLFTRLPRLPYGIRPMPEATAPGDTTARYQPGSPETGIAGFYLVNTSKLDQRPLWEIPVLSVHEAVPGHHMQIATQQELDLPAWRRNTVYITAFIEGWGLYSERLGLDMGLYDTPEQEMGRLSYQMWRATRLVVDTGLHSKGWSKDQAVAYMRDNSALTDANIDAEVNRYISNPGQALAYKIGQRKIEELRSRAEAALGARFDVRRFHDAVLGQGAVPLDTLDAQINAWIAAEKH